ncbi:FAD:protein FMN transferase [Rhizobium leguminosarum]|nr:FAD:protein FMN transferase [Rhizobium leguminosarum]
MLTSRFKFDAIGTSWEIDTPTPLRGDIREHILDIVERFDSVYSRFRKDSIVMRISEAKGVGSFTFPSEAVTMFDLYDRLHAATEGAVDPLVGRDLELLGYDREYSLAPRPREEGLLRPSWHRDVIRDGSQLTTLRPLMIDLGAVGKGYLVDVVADVLEKAGLVDFIVDGSGDMRHRGSSALDVGLEHPLDPEMVIGLANLNNRSLCASAPNRRRWGDTLHHVLDGRTGQPTSDVIATWAVAADTATADGLATALFFGSASRLMAAFDFSYVRMFADGRVEASGNFEGELFT